MDEDLNTLSKMIDLYKKSGEFLPYYKLEIVSYYVVCCVTCLEWHARSRLKDLFTYKPELIDLKDMQISVGADTLSQMVQKRLTIPDYIAAGVSVSSIDKYISVFDRVLCGIGSKRKSRSVLDGISSENKNYIRLDYIFQFRNSIVHEIGYTMIGSYSQRANICVDEAIEILNLTRRVIQNYENEISNCTDDLFPNKLDESYGLIDRETAIEKEILRIYNEISENLNGNNEFDGVYQDWRASAKAFFEFYQANEKFIDGLRLPGWRYMDPRYPLRARVRLAALEYLRALRENF